MLLLADKILLGSTYGDAPMFAMLVSAEMRKSVAQKTGPSWLLDDYVRKALLNAPAQVDAVALAEYTKDRIWEFVREKCVKTSSESELVQRVIVFFGMHKQFEIANELCGLPLLINKNPTAEAYIEALESILPKYTLKDADLVFLGTIVQKITERIEPGAKILSFVKILDDRLGAFESGSRQQKTAKDYVNTLRLKTELSKSPENLGIAMKHVLDKDRASIYTDLIFVAGKSDELLAMALRSKDLAWLRPSFTDYTDQMVVGSGKPVDQWIRDQLDLIIKSDTAAASDLFLHLQTIAATKAHQLFLGVYEDKYYELIKAGKYNFADVQKHVDANDDKFFTVIDKLIELGLAKTNDRELNTRALVQMLGKKFLVIAEIITLNIPGRQPLGLTELLGAIHAVCAKCDRNLDKLLNLLVLKLQKEDSATNWAGFAVPLGEAETKVLKAILADVEGCPGESAPAKELIKWVEGSWLGQNAFVVALLLGGGGFFLVAKRLHERNL